MAFKVTPVDNPLYWSQFLSLPREVYRNDPIWTPPGPGAEHVQLNPARNPVLRHQRIKLFLALSEGRPVGRIATIIDEFNPRADTGFFGCFECFNEPVAARLLFDQAARWLAEQGIAIMVGPATFNTNQKVGFLLEGFDSAPSHMMPYNPPYYGSLADSAGLVKLTDLLSYRWGIEQTLPASMAAVAARAEGAPGLIVRRLDFHYPEREAAIIRELFNTSFVNNWGFIPLTMAESMAMVGHLQQAGDPNLLLIAFIGQVPAGMLLGIPETPPRRSAGDSLQRNIRVAILAVKPKYRNRGLHTVLMLRFIESCRKHGYTGGELSQMDENNIIIKKIVTAITGNLIKRYRVYQKKLQPIDHNLRPGTGTV